MECPRCELGEIIHIRLKRDGSRAFLCDACELLWFEGETIDFNTGHFLASYSRREDREYTVEESDEEEQEDKPVKYVNTK